MEKNHMTKAGDHVMVGISGGADSVCLLFLLKRLSGLLGFTVEAIHVNHGLRQEADEEEAFVRTWCAQMEVPCRVIRVDVRAYAAKAHLGLEEAARCLRHQAFAQESKKWQQEKQSRIRIALAHHQNDQAETVLFHLFRGSGIQGLAGIQPVRGDLIRPLLCADRREIEAFVREQGLTYVTDQSNFDTTFARNRIRHELLPIAEQICEGSIQHIAASAAVAADAADFLKQALGQVYQENVREENGVLHIDRKVLAGQQAYIRSALIYEMIGQAAGRRKDIGQVHVEAVKDLLDKQSGKSRDLIYGIAAQIQQRELLIGPREAVLGLRAALQAVRLDPDGETLFGTTCFCARILSAQEVEKEQIPTEDTRKWFDYDKIKDAVVIRTRESGDYFYCSADARKKVKDYLIDEKVPISRRGEIPLLAEGSHILWVVGYRISQFYKVTQQTQRILEIRITKGETQDE